MHDGETYFAPTFIFKEEMVVPPLRFLGNHLKIKRHILKEDKLKYKQDKIEKVSGEAVSIS